MRFNKLDLNQLVVLDALLSERSVKKAADRLFLSPPATSCALARLREYFRDELLLQVGRTLVLTPKAESLAEPVREALLQIQAITNIDPVFDPATSTRKVRIVASDYVMSVFLAPLLQEAWQQAPLMKFDLHVIGPESHAELENGKVDMLVVPEFFAAPGHPTERVFEDNWSCVCWSGHGTPNQNITIEQYLEAGHVIIEWGAGRLTSSDETQALKLGYSRKREVTTPSFTVVPQLLIGTTRVATLQTRLALLLAGIAPLRIMPCPMPMPPLLECIQWHKHLQRDPAILWLRTLMRQVAKGLAPLPTVKPAGSHSRSRKRATKK